MQALIRLLLLAALAAGLSPLAVPVLEDQIWTTVKWTSVKTGKFPESRSGQYNLAYDPPNQRYRQSNKETTGNQTLIADYKNGVGYRIFNGVCTKVTMPANPPAKPILPDNAVDKGSTTVSGGQPADLWTAQIVVSGNTQNMEYGVETQPTAGRNPVRLFINNTRAVIDPTGKPYGMETRVDDWSNNLRLGPMPDWLFTPPAGCTNSSDELLSFKFEF
jgi:hypothetical protein